MEKYQVANKGHRMRKTIGLSEWKRRRRLVSLRKQWLMVVNCTEAGQEVHQPGGNGVHRLVHQHLKCKTAGWVFEQEQVNIVAVEVNRQSTKLLLIQDIGNGRDEHFCLERH